VVAWYSDAVEILAASKASDKLIVPNMARTMGGNGFLKLVICFRISESVEKWGGEVTSMT
jgi:hypothetical protein